MVRLSVLLPDPGLPWKKVDRVTEKVRQIIMDPDTQAVRRYWSSFAEAVVAAFRDAGEEAEVLIRPGWEFTPEFINSLPADVVLIPHRHRVHMAKLQVPALFYMQVLCRWLFTVDHLGWSAEASGYPCSDYVQGDEHGGAFDRYAEMLSNQNASKFAQPPRRSRLGLKFRDGLPLRPYIFFPCQIPHDQSARFCEHPEHEIVKKLADWAAERRVNVVFKEHPANPASMAPLRAVATNRWCHWVNASIHDLITHSKAVYTINSGVGFESLLHGKPVVTFGGVEYDAVTIHGDIDSLDAAWDCVTGFDRPGRMSEYRRFMDWFSRSYAVDLSAPKYLAERMPGIVDAIRKQAAIGRSPSVIEESAGQQGECEPS